MANEKTKKNKKNTNKKNTTKQVKNNDTQKQVVETKNQNTLKPKEKEMKTKTIENARRNLQYEKTNETDEISKLIKIILLVTAIIIVFYGVTVIVTKKAAEAKKEQEKVETEIQYDNVIIGSMLKIDGSYYVFIEKEDDDNLTEYETIIQTIAANDDAPKIYKANLTDSFNKIYLSDESNYDSDLSNFKVKGTALVKVENHKIIKVYDNYDDIKEKFEELQ